MQLKWLKHSLFFCPSLVEFDYAQCFHCCAISFPFYDTLYNCRGVESLLYRSPFETCALNSLQGIMQSVSIAIFTAFFWYCNYISVELNRYIYNGANHQQTHAHTQFSLSFSIYISLSHTVDQISCLLKQQQINYLFIAIAFCICARRFLAFVFEPPPELFM